MSKRGCMRKEQGFSTVEVLISAVITIVLLGGTMSSFNRGAGLSEDSRLMADLEQNLRTGINFAVQDFLTAGWGIPTGGIPIPSGNGAVAVKRPGPPGTAYTFDDEVIAAVNPGAGLGPASTGQATDMVNILYADNALLLNTKAAYSHCLQMAPTSPSTPQHPSRESGIPSVPAI